VMKAGVDRPLNHLQSRSMNAARCCRNPQSPVANRPRTPRAISFLISTGIVRPSCRDDNGPFVAANGTFVIALLGRLQLAIELGTMPR
jgi:hypothetical protein